MKPTRKPPSPTGKVKKVLIVGDHPVFRQVAQIITGEPALVVCGEFGSSQQAVDGTARLKPDVALLDITLPDRTGLEVIKQIRAAHPGVKVLVVSMHDEALYANRVLRLGGDGYITKPEDPTEVVIAIHDVLAGRIYVSEAVLGGQKAKEKPRPATPLDALSDSQLEILELLGQGVTYAEIGNKLGINKLAVANECEVMREALRLKSENALIRYAVCWVEIGLK